MREGGVGEEEVYATYMYVLNKRTKKCVIFFSV